MPPSAPPDVIEASAALLASQLHDMQSLFAQPESEHNWERFAKHLARLAALTRGGAYKLDGFLPTIGPAVNGGVGDSIVSCMLSERAALSKAAVDLLSSVAPRLANSFPPALQRLYIPPLLDLIRRTNNIVRTRAEAALFLVLETVPARESSRLLAPCAADANVNLRRAVGRGLAVCVGTWGAREVRADEVEGVVRKLAGDRDPEARKAGKELWECYCQTWPDRVDVFMAPLTPITRKRLGPRPAPSAAGVSASHALSRTAAPQTSKTRAGLSSSASSTAVRRAAAVAETVLSPPALSSHIRTALSSDPRRAALPQLQPLSTSTRPALATLASTAPSRAPLAPPLSAPPSSAGFSLSSAFASSSRTSSRSQQAHERDSSARTTATTASSSRTVGSRAQAALSRSHTATAEPSATTASSTRPALAHRAPPLSSSSSSATHARSASSSALLSALGPPARVAPRSTSSSTAATSSSASALSGAASGASGKARSVMGAPVRGGAGGGGMGGWMPKPRAAAAPPVPVARSAKLQDGVPEVGRAVVDHEQAVATRPAPVDDVFGGPADVVLLAQPDAHKVSLPKTPPASGQFVEEHDQADPFNAHEPAPAATAIPLPSSPVFTSPITALESAPSPPPLVGVVADLIDFSAPSPAPSPVRATPSAVAVETVTFADVPAPPPTNIFAEPARSVELPLPASPEPGWCAAQPAHEQKEEHGVAELVFPLAAASPRKEAGPFVEDALVVPALILLEEEMVVPGVASPPKPAAVPLPPSPPAPEPASAPARAPMAKSIVPARPPVKPVAPSARPARPLASVTRGRPPLPPPAAAATATAPAVRRERVKLKPPLPAFRPVSSRKRALEEVDLNKTGRTGAGPPGVGAGKSRGATTVASAVAGATKTTANARTAAERTTTNP